MGEATFGVSMVSLGVKTLLLCTITAWNFQCYFSIFPLTWQKISRLRVTSTFRITSMQQNARITQVKVHDWTFMVWLLPQAVYFLVTILYMVTILYVCQR